MVKHVAVDIPGALPEFTIADAAAIKAWAAGTATEDQQKRAFEFVAYHLSGIGKPSFHPGDPYATHFKEGRRSVAIHLAHLVSTPMDRLIPPKARGPNAS